MSEILLREDNAGVTTLTLNRPNQFNSLSEELLTALQETLNAIGEDESIRAVVIAGAGRAFCAGHDLKQMRANPTKAYYQQLFAQCGALMQTITAIPQPVIAKVHSIATAAGCQLVASCDLAICTDNARFAVSGINVGLFCSTPAVPLSRNLPRKKAFEMLVTGDFIDAETAQQYGLVNQVVAQEALDDAVQTLVDKICAKSAPAIATGKGMFYQQLESGLEAAYEFAAERMACNMMFDDAAEGIDAFMQKRKPEWTHKA